MGITLLEAVRQGLHRALERDHRVVIFGQDVGVNGGVFRATEGLQAAFGPLRVWDTPLAENLIAGMAIGMSTQGLRPVGEIQFCGFMYAIVDQMASHASRMRHRTRGRLSCPLVIRAPVGGGVHAPEHHSEHPEALFAHIPGIRVVIPSSPRQAYGLLLASIEDPDPVIFLEPKRLYHKGRQEVPDDGAMLPLDTAFVCREGHDITLVAWGACVQTITEASDVLAERGVSSEVIDLATLKPWDTGTVLTSVHKTGRLIVVHEAPKTLGLGADIAAHVQTYAHRVLKAPIHCITGYDTVMPLYRLEQHALPQVHDVVQRALSML